MKIAVYFDGVPAAGGRYSYQHTVLNILKEYADDRHEFVFFCENGNARRVIEQIGLQAVELPQGVFTRILRTLCRQSWTQSSGIFNKLLPNPLDRLFSEHQIDLVYFVGQHVVPMELKQHNFVLTLFDLCHLEETEFPEVSFSRQFEGREDYFRRVLPKAVAVIVDSNYGQKLACEKYNLDPARVVSLPFVVDKFYLEQNAALSTDDLVLERNSITRPYIFYPAQFWPHKNHIYLLEAIKHLKDIEGWPIQLVLSGSDKGNLNVILEKARLLGIVDLVKYVGFVEQADLYVLYKNALSLVMPTYFGPTNIPPLEAAAVGCPVCYSDKPSFREQMGEGAFYMDLDKPESLAVHLISIRDNKPLVNERVAKAKEKLKQWEAGDFWTGLSNVFSKYERKLACWKRL